MLTGSATTTISLKPILMWLAEFRCQEIAKELGVDVSLSAYFGRLATKDIKENDAKLYELLQDCLRTGLVSEALENYLTGKGFHLSRSGKYLKKLSPRKTNYPHRATHPLAVNDSPAVSSDQKAANDAEALRRTKATYGPRRRKKKV